MINVLRADGKFPGKDFPPFQLGEKELVRY